MLKLERVKKRYGFAPHGIMPHTKTDHNLYILHGPQQHKAECIVVPRDKRVQPTYESGHFRSMIHRVRAAGMLRQFREDVANNKGD